MDLSSNVDKSLVSRRPAAVRIGNLVIDPPVFQAPMAGFTNYAFRQIVRSFGGPGLQATEMISARGFVCMGERKGEYPDRLWGVRDEPRPLAVQIWDNDPGVMAEVGAKLVEEFRVSLVDINFGCPVRDVTVTAQSGSYLLRYPDRVGAIVARVAAVCRPTPVTAKIRLGCTRDAINAIDVAQAVEGAGGAALTIHGRTAQDMYRGHADWEEIARVKPYLRHIPLIGNGDLRSVRDVLAAFARYPVDGVMIARAALAKPWLFRQIQAALSETPIPPDLTLSQQRDLLLDHYRLIVERFGAERGTILMRRYACCYARGIPGARSFRGQVATVRTPHEFHAAVTEHFPVEIGHDLPAAPTPLV